MPGRRQQTQIFVKGLGGEKPVVPVDPRALEKAAQRKLSREAFAYVAGGAGLEQTMEANRQAFEKWQIVPRVLRDVTQRDLSAPLLGMTLPAPLMLAPIGVLEMAHPRADLAVAEAAASRGVPFVFSSQASVPMEECAEAMERVRPGAPRLFQLYWSTDERVVRSFVRRAEACGCRALVLTLDTTMLGWRMRDLDLAYLPFLRGKGIAQYTSDPAFRAALDEELPAPTVRPRLRLSTLRALWAQRRAVPDDTRRTGRRAVQRFVQTYSRPSLTWDDLARLRDMTSLPVVLKGILHPGDAREALARGVDGIYVSNHGGRQVDGAVGALNALPGIAEAVAGRVPVLFDSGVRTGADMFKARALGADAVCIGRPYVYGLALAGRRGVEAVIDHFVAELDLTMGLSGQTCLRDLDADVLRNA